MTRFAVAVLSALAYLSAFLMPMLPASAMSAPMQMTFAQSSYQSPSHSHCDDSGHAKTVKASPDLCRTGCAAHSPALPSQPLMPPRPWTPPSAHADASHQRLVASLVAPDPRPPRVFSFSL